MISAIYDWVRCEWQQNKYHEQSAPSIKMYDLDRDATSYTLVGFVVGCKSWSDFSCSTSGFFACTSISNKLPGAWAAIASCSCCMILSNVSRLASMYFRSWVYCLCASARFCSRYVGGGWPRGVAPLRRIRVNNKEGLSTILTHRLRKTEYARERTGSHMMWFLLPFLNMFCFGFCFLLGILRRDVLSSISLENWSNIRGFVDGDSYRTSEWRRQAG